MADWHGLRHDLESGVTPPPLSRLRDRRRRRQQRRTIAVTCAVAMVGTASGVALLGRAAERERAREPMAAPPTELTRIVNGGVLPPPRDYTAHVVTDVDFVSPTTGWAIGLRCVGETCAIATWRTDDGGATWSAPSDVATAVPRASFHEEDPGGGAVRSLRMVDGSRGYAFNPDLYATADGGRTWQRVPQPSKVTAVSVIGDSVWVTQRGCPRDVDCDVVVRTGRLGGALAPARVPETDGAAAIVRRAGRDEGYLLTWDAPQGPRAALHVTLDGGRTWQRRPHPCPDATAALLSAVAGRPLWLVCTTPGGRRAFRSENTGRSWQRLADPPGDGEVTDLAASSGGGAYLALQAPGRLLVTRDGGRSWTPATGTADAYGYANLDLVSPTHAWAMGDAGHLWRTTDGERWERLPLPPRAPHSSGTPTPPAAAPRDADVEFTGLSFTDRANGWALGRRCARERCRLVVRRTFDGGATWRVASAPAVELTTTPGSDGDVHSVLFADDRIGYLYGPGLFVTRDGGARWTRLPGRVQQVVVRDGYAWVLEYAVCGHDTDCHATVGRAPVGFDEFTYGFVAPDSPIPGRASLAVAGAHTAYLVDAQSDRAPVLLATSDGGRTWARRAAPCRGAHDRLAGVAGDHLWVLCGDEPAGPAQRLRTARSTDGGRTWREAEAGDGRLHTFVPLSPAVGWRADGGAAPTIRVTRDGGRTWHETPVADPGFAGGARAFQILDERHGFALLGGGAVVRTTDGRTWHPVARP